MSGIHGTGGGFDQTSRKCFQTGTHFSTDRLVEFNIHGQEIGFKLETGTDMNVLQALFTQH